MIAILKHWVFVALITFCWFQGASSLEPGKVKNSCTQNPDGSISYTSRIGNCTIERNIAKGAQVGSVKTRIGQVGCSSQIDRQQYNLESIKPLTEKTTREPQQLNSRALFDLPKTLCQSPKITLKQSTSSWHKYLVKQQNGQTDIYESGSLLFTIGKNNHQESIGKLKSCKDCGLGGFNCSNMTKEEIEEELSGIQFTKLTTLDGSEIRIYN